MGGPGASSPLKLVDARDASIRSDASIPLKLVVAREASIRPDASIPPDKDDAI